MSDEIPVIRLHTKNGELVARDGLVLSFFIHRNHEDVAHAIWRALQIYLRAIPPQSLGWYGSDEGDMVPLDDEGWEHNRKQILERSWGTAWIVELFENAGGGGSYQFEYHGRRIDEPSWPTPQNPATSVAFTFPTEYLVTHGPEHFRTLALEIARELPFSFGYASPAIISSSGAWFSLRKQVQEVLQRYLGLDLPRLGETSRNIGTQARGAYWLTFLGQPLLGQLGGRETVERQLDLPGVSVQSLDEERILVTLGERPEALDTERQSIPLPYREMTRVLEPFLFYEEEVTGLPWDPISLRLRNRRLGE
ncbi:DUF3396 domain-containing protein [Myxococcus sp. MISCRS1]|uniref:type VI immunity family protein n=1 Tax=Myxococcus sp. MISCRS1 TaxID=2996786 RepID=UPI0022700EC9|nr:type VI immunity family protein [Myxococcus sp. MISCRS1]MCY1002333.1 DUF3396 domain-containing protein [Myxococcus sp. MISCRS1]